MLIQKEKAFSMGHFPSYIWSCLTHRSIRVGIGCTEWQWPEAVFTLGLMPPEASHWPCGGHNLWPHQLHPMSLQREEVWHAPGAMSHWVAHATASPQWLAGRRGTAGSLRATLKPLCSLHREGTDIWEGLCLAQVFLTWFQWHDIIAGAEPI